MNINQKNFTWYGNCHARKERMMRNKCQIRGGRGGPWEGGWEGPKGGRGRAGGASRRENSRGSPPCGHMPPALCKLPPPTSQQLCCWRLLWSHLQGRGLEPREVERRGQVTQPGRGRGQSALREQGWVRAREEEEPGALAGPNAKVLWNVLEVPSDARGYDLKGHRW